MTKTLRQWLALLGATSLLAAALVAAPVQLDFASGTLDKAVAHAGEDGDQDGDTDQTNPDNPGQENEDD